MFVLDCPARLWPEPGAAPFLTAAPRCTALRDRVTATSTHVCIPHDLHVRPGHLMPLLKARRADGGRAQLAPGIASGVVPSGAPRMRDTARHDVASTCNFPRRQSCGACAAADRRNGDGERG